MHAFGKNWNTSSLVLLRWVVVVVVHSLMNMFYQINLLKQCFWLWLLMNICFAFFMQIVNDVKFTVNQAVEPVEKGITKFNQKLHKISQNIKRHDKEKRKTKDDSCITPIRRVIRGIDDPLLNGSFSDSGVSRGKKHRRKSGYTSGESGGESSSDQSYSAYQIRGGRWVTKD